MQQHQNDESAKSSDNIQKYAVVYTRQRQPLGTLKRGAASKRPSTMDGILTIRSPPSCLVTLTSNATTEPEPAGQSKDDDEDESDDDKEEPNSFKKGKRQRASFRQKKSRKQLNLHSQNRGSSHQILYSGKLVDIVLDACQTGLVEDKIVVLPGGYQCQIQRSLDKPTGTEMDQVTRLMATSLPENTLHPPILSNSCTIQHPTRLRGREAISSFRPMSYNSASAPSTSSSFGKENVVTSIKGADCKSTDTNILFPSTAAMRTSAASKKFSLHSLADEHFDEDIINNQDPAPLGHKTKKLKPHHHLESSTVVKTTTFRRTVVKRILTSSTHQRAVLHDADNTYSSTLQNPINKNSTTTNLIKFPGAIGDISIPCSITRVMRCHQSTGIEFLWNCLTGTSPALLKLSEREGSKISDTKNMFKGAILADQMGLGKTLMSIALICALHRRNKQQRFVIVCPSSLVVNWSKEFDKWIGKASQPSRIVIRKGGQIALRQVKAFVPQKPNMSEVLIVSFDMFRMHAQLLSSALQIGCLVVDEGHRLKNASGSLTLSALNSLTCESRLLITGTPIQNNLSEFYSIVEFVNPGLFRSLQSFRQEYANPILAAINRRATAQEKSIGMKQSQALNAITSTFLLRRLQKDVLGALLPPRSEALLFCRPSEKQRHRYHEIVQDFQKRSTSEEALAVLTTLRKLCCHPTLVENNNISLVDQDICTLQSGKILILDSLLTSIRNKHPTDKCIVVSNFTSALNVVEQSILRKRRWNSLRLDGTVAQDSRHALVESFNRGTAEQSFVFLLSSKAGGCGLNLIGANRLFMLDPDWNPATDAQAMARIYRQGQAKPCFVYRLFTTGTVEEIIYQRQTQKDNLSIWTGSTSRASTSFLREDLQECFELKSCDCDTKVKLKGDWGEYVGASSLILSGVTDEPLLHVAKENADVLSYAKICTESPSIECTSDNSDDGSAQSYTQKKKEVDTESSDEFEFEDDTN